MLMRTARPATLSLVIILSMVLFAGCLASSHAAAVWRTAFVKRGFVGTYKTEWAGGVGATIRNRAPIMFRGSKFRVVLRSDYAADSDLSKLSLAPAGANPGELGGNPIPVTFAGKPGIAIPRRSKDIVSDEVEAPIKAGTWFVQETFSSPTYPYAYNVDNAYFGAGDQHTTAILKNYQHGAWLGNAYRIDVLTTDTRPLIVCYGDSITAGYKSTPDIGHQYPDLLAKLIDCPVLNMGMNGDVITQRIYCAGEIRALDGVNAVVFLMGVNDILGGDIKTLDRYQQCATTIVKQLHQDGIRVYWGTISPFKGCKAACLPGTETPDSAKEALREQINDWIRTGIGADGVIDFDKALSDPTDPDRLNPIYERDWLHPNDAGYGKMAETAAAVLTPLKSSLMFGQNR